MPEWSDERSVSRSSDGSWFAHGSGEFDADDNDTEMDGSDSDDSVAPGRRPDARVDVRRNRFERRLRSHDSNRGGPVASTQEASM